jgi:hypothetical protein
LARAYWNGEEVAGDGGRGDPKRRGVRPGRGSRVGGNGEGLAERIKYRYDNHA